MKIVIAGSSGFIGSHLVSYLRRQGHELVLLNRNPDTAGSYFWDPEQEKIDLSCLEGADCVINLAGENILGRWTQKKMEAIKHSRLVSTQFLCTSLLKLKKLPSLFINASAVGYYGNRPSETLVETSSPGQDYLSLVCVEWEKIPLELLASRGVRVVFTRFGIVLGHGGALKHIEKAFGMGMGGTLGSGHQMMSWIAIDDLCRAMQHVIEHPEISGPLNFSSPHAISNLEFTKTLGKILHRPTIASVPKFALNMLFGAGAEVFLSSIQAHPQRLLESGYHFQYPEIEGALKKYLLTNA